MAIELYDHKALVTAAQNAAKPVAFLVGAPISYDNGGGVPGVAGTVELIGEEIRQRLPSAIPEFQAAINGLVGGPRYQAAMSWLAGRLLPDTVNRIVEQAVLHARRRGAPAEFDELGELSDWYLPAGVKDLGKLIATDQGQFPGPILTTNFDPLLAVAVETYKGRARWHILDSDGSIGRNSERRRGYTDIIHLHGYWRGSDTLHTEAQLSARRPALTLSLQSLLRQRTLLVAAYGGWDDVFTEALEMLLKFGAPEDRMAVNVLWCFREGDPIEVETRYGHLFRRLPSSRFLAYGGIDCHAVFRELEDAALARNRTQIPSRAELSPIAGWTKIDAADLRRLSSLTENELLRFFDGAVPTWRHAMSTSIPRREILSSILDRLDSFSPGTFGCSLQLIRAAGGEGKTTLLFQAAADMVCRSEWAVLWRSTPTAGLPPKHVLELDENRLWLLVADDAESLVEDLSQSARLLHEAGRSNVHFLIAARDADWLSKFGDKPPWESTISAWVRRKSAIMLRGITRNDAEAVIRSWANLGSSGLGELHKLQTTEEQVNRLIETVEATPLERYAVERRPSEGNGSFFGGLLRVRFSRAGLQCHVRAFLDRLREQRIGGTASTLFDALVYAAACHGIGLPGLDENVLADLVGVPRDWVHTLVTLKLGEEAAGVQSGGRILTRHRDVAAAVLVEADSMIDIAEVWRAIVRQTVQTRREVRLGPNFAMTVFAGPRLVSDLPKALPKERRHDIALAAATTAVSSRPDWLGCLVSLGKTYRSVGQPGSAAVMFRTNVGAAKTKTDFADDIRGYFHEWGVSEGLLGSEPGHRAADAWLQGLALSDYFYSAPITQENVKLICAGMGVAFGRLSNDKSGFPFAHARRAAVYLAAFTTSDPKALSYFEKHNREADEVGTPTPRKIEEAISWLRAAVMRARDLIDDTFLREIGAIEDIHFERLEAFVRRFCEEKEIPTASNYGDRETKTVSAQGSQDGRDVAGETKRAPKTGSAGELRDRVFRVITNLIEDSILKRRPLFLPYVGESLRGILGQETPIHRALGFRDLTDLVLSFDELTVTGEHPRWLVSLREAPVVAPERSLRYQVWSAIRDLMDEALFRQRPLYLAAVGSELVQRFPGATPVQHRLGYDNLTGLLGSFEDLDVRGVYPQQVVRYRTQHPISGVADLRSEVAAAIRRQIDLHAANDKPLLLVLLAVRLAEAFPEAKPIQKSLGFGTLTDLVLSFDDLIVTGEHPHWVVEYRDDTTPLEVENLREEVGTAIADLLDRAEATKKPLHLPAVGLALSDRFSQLKPIYRALGFDNLTELIVSFPDFVVTGSHPTWLVEYRS